MTKQITKLMTMLYFALLPYISFGQEYYPDSLANSATQVNPGQELSSSKIDGPKTAITIGILQGGGSLIGGDYEILLSDQFGVQVGAGLIGFGAGLNYHFRENDIRSSFLSLQLWNQGLGESFAQRVMGPVYVYRSKKWFTASLGIGAVLDRGPGFPDNLERTPIILMYSIGAYFPQ